VNNLPNVATQRCLEYDLNPRPIDRKSNRIPVAPPRHLAAITRPYYARQLSRTAVVEHDEARLGAGHQQWIRCRVGFYMSEFSRHHRLTAADAARR